eukprot:1845819-Amphidinium_carterae.1
MKESRRACVARCEYASFITRILHILLRSEHVSSSVYSCRCGLGMTFNSSSPSCGLQIMVSKVEK